MAATLPILKDVAAHIQSKMPDVETRLFPDDPKTYRFVHPKGAVLVGYQGSSFIKPHDTHAIVQQRTLTLHLTVFGRGVHNDAGTLELLDRLRLAITGHKPVDCNKIHLQAESFVDEGGGVWQYQLIVQTETQQVELVEEPPKPKVSALYLRGPGEPLDPNIKPQTP